MVDLSRYGRERLPSEQIEKLRTNFAYALSTRTPEPRLEAISETSQPVTTGSSRPALSKGKRKRNNTNALRKSEARNTSPAPESDVVVETRQLTRLGLSISAPPSRKRKRTTDFLGELELNQKSPELELASGSESHRPITRGSSQPPSRKRARKSKMLRELDPHNESPEQESEPDMEMIHESTKTRSAARKVVSFLKNRTPTPPKNLNIKRLMHAELSGTPNGTKTWYFPNDSNPGSSSQQRQPESRQSIDVNIKEEDEEGSLFEKIRTSGRSRSQSRSTRRTMSQQSRNSLADSRQDPAVALESAWSMWDREKGRINDLVNSPRYGQNLLQQAAGAQSSKKPAYRVTPESPEGFQGPCHVVEGLHIFTPTAADFSHFKHFLDAVEEVTGRELGVVKVIVPSECLLRTPTPGISTTRRAPVMKTVNISLSLNDDAAKEPFIAYSMLMRNESTSLEPEDVLHMIQCDKENVIEECLREGEHVDHENVWRGNHALRPYSEEQMIQRSEKNDKACLCVLNQLVTPDLRAALGCKNPNIENFQGNNFMDSRSTEAGINEPVFHVATDAGPLSPLQTNKYAAYSLNYHHSGAPRILMVTRPKRHAEVENAVYDAQDIGNLFLSRPEHPSTCSQFVAHQPIYVPSTTLSSLRISHTEVVQHQGELVIIFPWAYHQAYTSGPNITEEILYAGDRCKIFHEEKLYRHCGPDCTGGQPDDFDTALVFFDTLSGIRSDGRYRQDREP